MLMNFHILCIRLNRILFQKVCSSQRCWVRSFPTSLQSRMVSHSCGLSSTDTTHWWHKLVLRSSKISFYHTIVRVCFHALSNPVSVLENCLKKSHTQGKDCPYKCLQRGSNVLKGNTGTGLTVPTSADSVGFSQPRFKCTHKCLWHGFNCACKCL